MSVLLETPRLRIRRWRLEDAPAAFAMFSDPLVMRYVGDGRPVGKLETVRERLAKRIIRYQTERLGSWAVERKEDGALIGGCSLSVVEEGPEIEVAYQFGREHWGRGYATESASAMVGYGFGTLALDRIVGITYPQNTPSQRVLLKLGMRALGPARYFGLDLLVFEIHRPEWDGRPR